MPFMTWRDEYSVHHATLDFDHQMLINIINQLFDAMAEKQGHEVVGRTIESLERYVQVHFAREEKVMRECNYPDFGPHAEGHREIERTVADIRSLWERAPEEVNCAEVMRFLKTWLVNHILKTDMKYAPYVEHEGRLPEVVE
ncbi:bacteriohemerythrin [Caenispirillum salinarum]|nr:bacteriohemerythrin [Caenispirillum salinarum]